MPSLSMNDFLLLALLSPLCSTAPVDEILYTEAILGPVPTSKSVHAFFSNEGVMTVAGPNVEQAPTTQHRGYLLETPGLWPLEADASLPSAHGALKVTADGIKAYAYGVSANFQPELGPKTSFFSAPSDTKYLPTTDGRLYSQDQLFELKSDGSIAVSAAPFGTEPRPNQSIAGEWAADTKSVFKYDSVSGAWVTSNQVSAGALAAGIDGEGNYATLHLQEGVPFLEYFERSPFGFWVSHGTATYSGKTDDLYNARLTVRDGWAVLNKRSGGHAVFSVDVAGEVQEVDVYDRQADTPHYWVHPEANGNLTRYRVLNLHEHNAVDLLGTADVNTVPVKGGDQVLQLKGLSTYQGFKVLWIGSMAGTAPGIEYSGDIIPLNFGPYLSYLLNNTGSANITNQIALLNNSGIAQATVAIPALHVSLLGTELNHVGLVYRPIPSGSSIDPYYRLVGPIPLTITQD